LFFEKKQTSASVLARWHPSDVKIHEREQREGFRCRTDGVRGELSSQT
jgi:hypothetical protein